MSNSSFTKFTTNFTLYLTFVFFPLSSDIFLGFKNELIEDFYVCNNNQVLSNSFV